MDRLKNSFRLDFFFIKKTPFFSTVKNQNMGIRDAYIRYFAIEKI